MWIHRRARTASETRALWPGTLRMRGGWVGERDRMCSSPSQFLARRASRSASLTSTSASSSSSSALRDASLHVGSSLSSRRPSHRQSSAHRLSHRQSSEAEARLPPLGRGPRSSSSLPACVTERGRLPGQAFAAPTSAQLTAHSSQLAASVASRMMGARAPVHVNPMHCPCKRVCAAGGRERNGAARKAGRRIGGGVHQI
jgi:hypothetical protein